MSPSISGWHAAPPAAVDLRSLFDSQYASVWRLLKRLGVRTAQLDDAAQEVFWVAARRLQDIQPGRERAFLYGVALRVAMNEQRRVKATAWLAPVEQCPEIADEAATPEALVEQREARALLDRVLNQLPIELRSVLVLYELEGLEIRQIAELEGVPLGTAGSRLRRAREEFSAHAKRVRATLQARGAGRR